MDLLECKYVIRGCLVLGELSNLPRQWLYLVVAVKPAELGLAMVFAPTMVAVAAQPAVAPPQRCVRGLGIRRMIIPSSEGLTRDAATQATLFAG